MLSRFDLIPERYGRTDRQTDGQICYINIAHQHTALLTRDKNSFKTLKHKTVIACKFLNVVLLCCGEVKHCSYKN